MVSIITYPYWFGILISGQMLQNNLGQLPFSPNAVHYLIGFVLGYESGLYELHKTSCCSYMAYLEQSFDRHGGIPQPTEPIIPITYFADGFGQTGSKGGQYGSVIVRHQFQNQHASFYHIIIERIFLSTVGPIKPINQSTAIFNFFPFNVHRNDLFIV